MAVRGRFVDTAVGTTQLLGHTTRKAVPRRESGVQGDAELPTTEPLAPLSSS